MRAADRYAYMLSGISIFPAVLTFGVDPAQAFITIPTVFSHPTRQHRRHVLYSCDHSDSTPAAVVALAPAAAVTVGVSGGTLACDIVRLTIAYLIEPSALA